MKTITYILIKLILGYKFLISPLLGHSCRYFPSCSDYSVEALKEFGFFKGVYLSVKRILSCQPWGKGGFDPIKKINESKK